MEKFKNKKVHLAATFGGIAIAGVMLFQGAIPKGAEVPKIDVISPNQGPAGTQVIISGSGFTTSVQGIVGTKVKETVYTPGNYVLIKDEVISQPILSPDGKTLTVRIDLISDKVRRECEDKFSMKSPQPCKVPIKVVNAYGKPSNDVHFTITGREIKKLTYTIENLPMPAPAVIHATIPGQEWSGDEVMHIRVSAPATNEQTISDINLVIALDTGTFGGAPISCLYFSATSPDPLIGPHFGAGGTFTMGSPVAVGGAWMTNINDPTEEFNGSGPIGLDMGMFSGPRYAPTISCAIWVSSIGLAPGTHKDLAIHMKMYAQNYALKADGTYTPLAEESRTFNLLARTFTFYNGAGYYVVDNSPDNGYIIANAYPSDGGLQFNLGLSKLIMSDPIKIIPQSIPTPAGYFPY